MLKILGKIVLKIQHEDSIEKSIQLWRLLQFTSLATINTWGDSWILNLRPWTRSLHLLKSIAAQKNTALLGRIKTSTTHGCTGEARYRLGLDFHKDFFFWTWFRARCLGDISRWWYINQELMLFNKQMYIRTCIHKHYSACRYYAWPKGMFVCDPSVWQWLTSMKHWRDSLNGSESTGGFWFPCVFGNTPAPLIVDPVMWFVQSVHTDSLLPFLKS